LFDIKTSVHTEKEEPKKIEKKVSCSQQLYSDIIRNHSLEVPMENIQISDNTEDEDKE